MSEGGLSQVSDIRFEKMERKSNQVILKGRCYNTGAIKLESIRLSHIVRLCAEDGYLKILYESESKWNWVQFRSQYKAVEFFEQLTDWIADDV